MNYSRAGKCMMITALILAVCIVLLIQPLTGLWIGLLGLAFFLYATGLTITSYGESTTQQQENYRIIIMRLDSLEKQLKDIHSRLNKGNT